MDSKERLNDVEFKEAVTIDKNVRIGGNCCIILGVTIGDNMIIGAGSIITKDIPENDIVAGNPCRIIKCEK